MNINAMYGDKVAYQPTTKFRPELANDHLEVSEIYTVDYIDDTNSTSDLYLVEFPGIAFNGVHFEEVIISEEPEFFTVVKQVSTAVDVNAKLSDRFDLYQKAINKIDDYFEYGEHSEKDKKFVMNALDDLAISLRHLEE